MVVLAFSACAFASRSPRSDASVLVAVSRAGRRRGICRRRGSVPVPPAGPPRPASPPPLAPLPPPAALAAFGRRRPPLVALASPRRPTLTCPTPEPRRGGPRSASRTAAATSRCRARPPLGAPRERALSLAAVGATRAIVLGRRERTCEYARAEYPDVITCCVFSSGLPDHPGFARWGARLAEPDHVFRLWLARYRLAHHLVERRVSVLVSDADVWFARNPFPLLRDPGGALWRHAIVANVEGAEFPGVNGGLAYFRGDDDDEDFVDDDDDFGTKRVLLRRTASAFLLGLFDAHLDELLRLDPAPMCRDGKTPVRGALMDQDVLRDDHRRRLGRAERVAEPRPGRCACVGDEREKALRDDLERNPGPRTRGGDTTAAMIGGDESRSRRRRRRRWGRNQTTPDDDARVGRSGARAPAAVRGARRPRPPPVPRRSAVARDVAERVDAAKNATGVFPSSKQLLPPRRPSRRVRRTTATRSGGSRSPCPAPCFTRWAPGRT